MTEFVGGRLSQKIFVHENAFRGLRLFARLVDTCLVTVHRGEKNDLYEEEGSLACEHTSSTRPSAAKAEGDGELAGTPYTYVGLSLGRVCFRIVMNRSGDSRMVET